MGSFSNQPFVRFLASLKRAGVSISNEHELRERLAEVKSWRYAFATLASNGHLLGIRFRDREARVKDEDIHRTFVRYQFPESLELAFTASLRSSY